MGVPVKHHRNLPCNSQHAIAPFVLTFLILCASSKQWSSSDNLKNADIHVPRTIRNHLTPYRAHFFAAFDLFLMVLGSESESESFLAFVFEDDALDSFLAAGLNALYSDLTVSYVVTTICCLCNTAGSVEESFQLILGMKELNEVTRCSVTSMVFDDTKASHLFDFRSPLFNESERTDHPEIESEYCRQE